MGMKILGIDTSTKTGSVAVVNKNGLVAQYTLSIEVTHSERLMTTLDRVLKDAGLSLDEINGYAVSIGPGSFTGLRVGISTVKGLAFATGRPIAPVPTLEAMAWNIPFCGHVVCPMLDAKKREVYAGIYRFEGPTLVCEMDAAAVSLPALFSKIRGTAVFVGEAALFYRAEIEEALSGRALFAPLSHSSPSAGSVAEIGLRMIEQGVVCDLDALAPMYIRRPEAEVQWEKRRISS